jgi:AraC-like DNA-binding protein
MSSRLLRVTDWEELATNANYEPEQLAALCSISLRQLERFFKLKFEKNPAAWIRDLKCGRAATLISSGYSTKAAALEVGFASASHFCREFKKVYGSSPQTFSPDPATKPKPKSSPKESKA